MTTDSTLHGGNVLGYANARNSMLSIPPLTATSNHLLLEAGQPVTDRDNKLTGFQPSLEPYVSMNLLRRILKGDAKFSNWDENVERRRNRPRMAPAPETRSVIDSAPPHATISSDKGIEITGRREAVVIEADAPVAKAPEAISGLSETTAEVAPPPRRGRPPKPKSDAIIQHGEAPAEIQDAAPPTIEERDGKFWIGDKDFDTDAAARAYLKLT